jgi:dTDP-4-dehydrorhamnose reductase
MKRALIIGYGLLGKALQQAKWISAFELVVASRHGSESIRDLDISDEGQVIRFFKEHHDFEFVINCAAMSDVDGCEENPVEARAVNALAVKFLAKACAEFQIPFVQLSTNYVFDGNKKEGYAEEDPVGPCSVYGLTKLEGEQYALRGAPNVLVVRTSWLFGNNPKGFVNQVAKKFEDGAEIQIMADQISSTTYTRDLATAIGRLVENVLLPSLVEKKPLSNVYHVTNEGACTRFDMVQCMKKVLKKPNVIKRIDRADVSGWVAMRPRYSVLRNIHFKKRFDGPMRHWEEALEEYLKTEHTPCAS